MNAETDDRPCGREGCTGRVRRRTRDSDEQAARRRFCSLDCYRAHVAVERPTRTCERCGGTFGPSRHERVAQFVKRAPRFCSQACNGAARSARAAGPDRTCARASCGAVLVARPGESPSALRARKFCDTTCAGVARRVEPAARKPRARPKAERPKPALSVFGDVAPSRPWRPAGFSAEPGAADVQCTTVRRPPTVEGRTGEGEPC